MSLLGESLYNHNIIHAMLAAGDKGTAVKCTKKSSTQKSTGIKSDSQLKKKKINRLNISIK